MVICFDLDNTLVDLEKPIKKIFKKHKLKYQPAFDWELSNYPAHIKNEVLEMFKDSNVMCKLKPFYNAKKFIKSLKNKGFSIYIITARSKNIANETIEFVEKLFDVPCFVVKPNQSKLSMLKKLKADFWIDDCPTHLNDYRKNGIYSTMISNKNTPYNHYMRDKVGWLKNINELYKLYKKNIFIY